MQIFGPTHVHGPQSVNAPHSSRPTKEPSSPVRASSTSGDRLDISPAAETAAQASEIGGVRQELVDQIKQQITTGTYETAEKLDVAVDRLLDELV